MQDTDKMNFAEKKAFYLAEIECIPVAAYNAEQKALASFIIACADERNLDALYTFITRRVKLGFVFDAAPEVNHNACALVKRDAALSFEAAELPALPPRHSERSEESHDNAVILSESEESHDKRCFAQACEQAHAQHDINAAPQHDGKERDSPIVLDFFAGSGTTAQAVMELNAEDGGRRVCILATNNENEIAERVTRERLFRVTHGQGSKGESIKWKYSAELPFLAGNALDAFRIETHHLEIEDYEKAERLVVDARKTFPLLREGWLPQGEFSIYDDLASLKPCEE